MNFGWDLTLDSRGNGLDTPVHEIGHTLGFPHEHQNPFAGIIWDEQAVIRQFSAPPNRWTEAQIRHNILRKLSTQEVEGSRWDPNSIMHYSFGAGLIIEPSEYQDGISPAHGLSEIDKQRARQFYPRSNTSETNLQLMVPVQLDVSKGEQKNFLIIPTYSDDYVIQTIGRSDTVMVLFEYVENQLEQIAADDDSGHATNAEIRIRLLKGKRYILRVRLYLEWASGATAVLWHQ
mmetsp:Transcript_16256/g.18409  ORF Transcript_16256/g.18409 Transcript_16256/m.18409 type:complete len:233 (+) Transcript_16256:367-1065(+)